MSAACAARRVEIWIGGDVHLGRGGAGALGGIPEIVGGARGIVNLEGPIGDGEARPERLTQSAAALRELRAAGVVAAGIANNHAGDVGAGGPAATARALREAGILPVGGPADVAVIHAGGFKIVVTQHDLGAGVPDGLAGDLARARRRGDLLIATFHVTAPPSYLPSRELQQAVAIALGAGAHVVAAHGSHALARVDRVGDAVVAWGLGNLAFACDCTDEEDAALLRLSLTARGVAAAWIIPIDAGLRGGAARRASEPALIFELLDALGSSPLHRAKDHAAF